MARPIDADALLKALNKIDSDNKLVFKIGDKVVCKRDGKIQIITQIEKVEYTTKDKGTYNYNGKYWSEELRYAKPEEVAKYFQ